MADVKIPILDLDDMDYLWVFDELLGIVVYDPGEEGLLFGIALNSEKFQTLSNHFGDDYWQSLSINDFSISLRVINDLRDPVTITLSGVYANQIPVVYSEDFTLERRDVLEVRLSDVVRDFAFENEVVLFGIL